MLAYDQPIIQPKPDIAAAPPPARFSVTDLVRLLWRRKVPIAAAAIICACTAVMIGKSLTPRYAATAQLYVDPRELQLVDRELTPRSQDIAGLSMVVESQARLITSNNVLLRVIDDRKLERDPEFGGEASGLLRSLSGLIGLSGGPTASADNGKMSALDALNRHINVKRTDRTYVVDIEVWSHEPAKAAMLANAVSAAYLAESKQSQADAARRATTDLSSRLKELQDRLRTSENALAIYKAQNNFVGTQDTLVSDQQLSAITQRLANAHALTLDAQAKYDQIEASRRGATDAGAIPEALQSPTIANLRAQYAEARRKHAELSSELGPRHPSLKNMEKQVEDLRRNITEELSRFSQSAKNDLTRARDYEASLTKALDQQKHQSVDLSQASVQLRELERDVEANRNVYQSFLKRSRETEEQETLNTSAARIIGEAAAPQRRAFPPAMSLIAMIGFAIGALAAAAWTVAADRLSIPGAATPATEAPRKQPRATLSPDMKIMIEPPLPQGNTPQQAAAAPLEKPLIARLQETDVLRTLTGILAAPGVGDVTRMGWPTLRANGPAGAFVAAIHALCETAAKRAPGGLTPVIGIIGAGDGADRTVVALNAALAAARDGVKVLMIDADHATHALSDKADGLGKPEASRRGWLSIGSKAARAIKTSNGIAILPAVRGSGARAGDAIRKAIAQARASGGYDLVILDGPPMPWEASNRNLLETADGLIAVLPVDLDINDAMEAVIAALGGAERNLIGVVLNELNPAGSSQQRGKRYA
ncbi:exopolysaccharide transport family protein [uncultured Bradyrhizobium sp.]|uniref:exopolysaccharide transport family protein n=1 Tax=uncultured Bradyrhizobium sp. TaxID=199684 RepID=UPI0035CAF4E5